MDCTRPTSRRKRISGVHETRMKSGRLVDAETLQLDWYAKVGAAHHMEKSHFRGTDFRGAKSFVTPYTPLLMRVESTRASDRALGLVTSLAHSGRGLARRTPPPDPLSLSSGSLSHTSPVQSHRHRATDRNVSATYLGDHQNLTSRSSCRTRPDTAEPWKLP